MLPKLRVEGLSVICPLPPNAVEVRERIAEKKTNKRNPREISLQLGELFTTQPHVPRESYAEGDKKPQPGFSPMHGCSTRKCGTSSLQPMAEQRQITEGHREPRIDHVGPCPFDRSFSFFFSCVGSARHQRPDCWSARTFIKWIHHLFSAKRKLRRRIQAAEPRGLRHLLMRPARHPVHPMSRGKKAHRNAVGDYHRRSTCLFDPSNA